jgi:hypothetical protein
MKTATSSGFYEARLAKLEKTQKKIALLERLKGKVSRLEKQVAKVLGEGTLTYTPNIGLPPGGRAINVWPKSPSWRSDFEVLEVTGKINNLYVANRWFPLEQWEEAVTYLNTLHKGNIWVSQAWKEGNALYTGQRKRVALK